MWFSCPLCEQQREVRRTKKGKPYVICDPCGLQMFFRYPEGIRRLGLRATPLGNTLGKPAESDEGQQ